MVDSLEQPATKILIVVSGGVASVEAVSGKVEVVLVNMDLTEADDDPSVVTENFSGGTDDFDAAVRAVSGGTNDFDAAVCAVRKHLWDTSGTIRSDTHPTSVALGYVVERDADQPNLFVWKLLDGDRFVEGSDVSYDSEEAAWDGAETVAIGAVMDANDISSGDWEDLSGREKMRLASTTKDAGIHPKSGMRG